MQVKFFVKKLLLFGRKSDAKDFFYRKTKTQKNLNVFRQFMTSAQRRKNVLPTLMDEFVKYFQDSYFISDAPNC